MKSASAPEVMQCRPTKEKRQLIVGIGRGHGACLPPFPTARSALEVCYLERTQNVLLVHNSDRDKPCPFIEQHRASCQGYTLRAFMPRVVPVCLIPVPRFPVSNAMGTRPAGHLSRCSLRLMSARAGFLGCKNAAQFATLDAIGRTETTMGQGHS